LLTLRVRSKHHFKESFLMNTSVVVGSIDTVFNQRQVDRLQEYVASDVVDHNQIIFAESDGPDGLAEGVLYEARITS
jgi:hypothetical protein